MTKSQKISLLFLRASIGWLLFYAGITKVIDPHWSAEGYLAGAKTFHWFYAFLAQPNMLPLTNFVNEWGLTILGAFLILGIFTRFSSIAAAVMMLLLLPAGTIFPSSESKRLHSRPAYNLHFRPVFSRQPPRRAHLWPRQSLCQIANLLEISRAPKLAGLVRNKRNVLRPQPEYLKKLYISRKRV